MENIAVNTSPTDLEYIRINKIECYTATSVSVFMDNVKKNVKRGLKRFHEMESFQKIKGNENPIALIGGGPSIKLELDRIIDFKLSGYPVIACGSSYDWLVDSGVIPDYCTICDPDPVTINYLKKAHKDTTYLVASSCDEVVFDYLKNYNVYLWHCHSDERAAEVSKLDSEVGVIYQGISGGCTVGLRSICISMMLGYTNIHFWGFDSCMGEENEHHAYGFSDKAEIAGLGNFYDIKVGSYQNVHKDSKVYNCAGYHLAQAFHFERFYSVFHICFIPTFHGGGLIADVCRNMQEHMKLNTKAA